MHRFYAYLETLRQYLATPKGHHDFFDVCQAVVWIFLTILLAWFLLQRCSILF